MFFFTFKETAGAFSTDSHQCGGGQHLSAWAPGGHVVGARSVEEPAPASMDANAVGVRNVEERAFAQLPVWADM